MPTPSHYIGTAGWSVPSRYADQIPQGGSHLQRYARRLNAVEINSSFYRPHQRKTYERWAASTPDHFRFCVKVPKAITHELRLSGCVALLDRFVVEVGGLGDKLGALLLQLPPSFRFEKKTVRQFFRDLRKRLDTPAVLEPRHSSWFTPNVDKFLADIHVARVAADPARAGGREPGGWDGVAYYRWHGSPRVYYSDYDASALSSLGEKLRQDRRHPLVTWCIFDNTASGAALGNALRLVQDLNGRGRATPA